MWRSLLICCVIFCLWASPVFAAESPESGFVLRLQSCLDGFQADSDSFQALQIDSTGNSVFVSDGPANHSETKSETRINLEDMAGYTRNTYTDDNNQSDSCFYIDNNSTEYYADGRRYRPAYDFSGRPLEGQYFYEPLHLEQRGILDIRRNIPSFASMDKGLRYILGLFPDSCFKQNGDWYQFDAGSSDFKVVATILTARVKAGDPEAIDALKQVFPPLMGFDFSPDYFGDDGIYANERDLSYLFYSKFGGGINSLQSARYSGSGYPSSDENPLPDDYIEVHYTIMSDGNMLKTAFHSTHIFYPDPEHPDFSWKSENTLNTCLDSSNKSFSRDIIAHEETSPYDYYLNDENQPFPITDPSPPSSGQQLISDTSDHTEVKYLSEKLELTIPEFTSENSRRAPYTSTSPPIWEVLNSI